MESETEEAEANSNQAEFEDAESKEEKIIQMLKHQDQMIEEEVGLLESEIQGLQRELSQYDKLGKQAIEDLEKIINYLEDIKADFQTNISEDNRQVLKKDFESLKLILEVITNLSQLTLRYMQKEEDSVDATKTYVMEMMKLENNTEELAEELGADESEIEELIQTAKQWGDKNEFEEAEQEAEQMEEIEEYWRKFENEEEKIAQKMNQEIEESEVIIDEDERIVELSDQIYQDLDEFEQWLMDNQDGSNPLFGAKSFKTIFDDMHRTKNQLKNVIQSERTELEKLKGRLNETNKGAKKAFNKAKENSDIDFDFTGKQVAKTSGKFLLYSAVIILIILGLIVVVFFVVLII
jgi:chromosome segregation ATPase